jgi:hypothetical protein
MPGMVGLLTAAGVAMTALAGLTHGDLVFAIIACASSAAGLAAYAPLPPSKKVSLCTWDRVPSLQLQTAHVLRSALSSRLVPVSFRTRSLLRSLRCAQSCRRPRVGPCAISLGTGLSCLRWSGPCRSTARVH